MTVLPLVGEKETGLIMSRLNLIVAITAAIQESSKSEIAFQRALRAIRAYTGWPIGHIYFGKSANDLISSGVWSYSGYEKFSAFRQQALEGKFAPSLSLVDRVLLLRQPLLANLPLAGKGEEAIETVIYAPIIGKDSAVGLMEFFSAKPMEEISSSLANILILAGKQIGRFFEEKEFKNLREKMAEESETLNADLDNFSKALLNILEDARELGKQLVEEKRNVEQKVIERTRELAEEQARLVASINALSFGFVIADIGHRVLLGNKAMMELFGLNDSDEITVDQISKFLGGHFDIKMEAERCLKGGIVCEIKEIIFGKKFLRGIVAPIVMKQDYKEVIGYVLLFENITEAKVIERSREEFFAVASHELRTPLTAIRGNATLIKDFYADKIKNKEIMAMISDIHEASERLIRIVYDFLDASALEQRKIEFKKEQFDIIALIKEVARDLKGMAKAKKLYLNLEKTDVALPMAVADKDRTKQVLFNFISNGINYTQKGGVSIKVEKQDKFLKVYVSDTGIGISSENQALLFRKFQQAGEKMLTRDATKGAGLGLYISKLLVESMAGTIELVKSQPGAGSVFNFTLPIASRFLS